MKKYWILDIDEAIKANYVERLIRENKDGSYTVLETRGETNE